MKIKSFKKIFPSFLIIGILLLSFTIALLYFGIPLIKASMGITNNTTPSKVDVNVNQGQPANGANTNGIVLPTPNPTPLPTQIPTPTPMITPTPSSTPTSARPQPTPLPTGY